jgi:hypothetical protein
MTIEEQEWRYSQDAFPGLTILDTQKDFIRMYDFCDQWYPELVECLPDDLLII